MIIRSKSDLKQVFTMLYQQAEVLLSCGKQVRAEICEFIKKRSVEANNYYWLICKEVGDFLDEAGLSYGEYKLKYNKDLIHEINKQIFGVETTTKMNVREFCDYTTKMIQFWQEKTNFNWCPSELPISYLIAKGYNEKDLI